jgi:hypothetical protein
MHCTSPPKPSTDPLAGADQQTFFAEAASTWRSAGDADGKPLIRLRMPILAAALALPRP